MQSIDTTNGLDGIYNYADSHLKNSYYSVDKNIQKQSVSFLNGAIKSARVLRDEYSEARDELNANDCLSAIMYLYLVRRRINIFLLLKSSRPQNAYDELIDAQRIAEKAIYADLRPEAFLVRLLELEEIEHSLFPRQMWQSMGFIAKKIICSICNNSVDECIHRSGKAYMGHLCYYKYDDLEMDHTAVIVEGRPENKKCRITQYASDGKYYDTLTKNVLRVAEGADRFIKGRLLLYKEPIY